VAVVVMMAVAIMTAPAVVAAFVTGFALILIGPRKGRSSGDAFVQTDAIELAAPTMAESRLVGMLLDRHGGALRLCWLRFGQLKRFGRGGRCRWRDVSWGRDDALGKRTG
jgi:hypothetical protein